jgi:tRNA pseudouridine55 synthase
MWRSPAIAAADGGGGVRPADAHTFEELQSAANGDALEDFFVHPRKILPRFSSVTANEEMAAHIRSGRTVNLPEFSKAQQVKVFSGQRELIAIASRVAGTLFHPKIVLVGSETVQTVK